MEAWVYVWSAPNPWRLGMSCTLVWLRGASGNLSSGAHIFLQFPERAHPQ